MKHVLASLTSILVLGILAVGVASPSFAQTACEAARLTASDGGVFDSFGRAVAISGETALLGTFWDDDNGNNSGSAYVFSFNGTAWFQRQKLLASDGQGGVPNGDWFGVAVTIDGDTAVIGASAVDGGGAAYVFRFDADTSTWIETQKLLASDREVGDHFGISVEISGDVAVIGAWGDDDNGANSGSAYVFRVDPKTSQWIEDQKLLASDGAAGDFFGTAVAVSGAPPGWIIVGADGHDDTAESAGAAYVFRYDADTSAWVQEQKLLASDGAKIDRFGDSVSISGETALIGARLDGNGSAYVFRFDPAGAPGSQWVQEQKLVASDPGGTDQFGKSVALDGDTAVIGAWSSDAVGPSSGAAYVFRDDPAGKPGAQWTQQNILLPDPNQWTNFFGYSVAIDGDTAVIGAHGEDHQAGAAYIYDLAACLCPADLDGDGNVGILDLLSLLAAWGTDPGGPPDFDGDGTVGILDLLTLLANWGACP